MSTAFHVIRKDSRYEARAGGKVLGTFETELEAKARVNQERAKRLDSRGLTGEPEDQERDNEEDGDEDAGENERRALNGETQQRSRPQKGTGYGTENAEEAGDASDDGDGDEDEDDVEEEDDADGDDDGDSDDDHDAPGSGMGRGVAILARVRKTHKDLYDTLAPHAIVGAYKASRKKAQDEMDSPEDISHNQVMSHMTGAEY